LQLVSGQPHLEACCARLGLHADEATVAANNALCSIQTKAEA
jgi:hypothetical protein